MSLPKIQSLSTYPHVSGGKHFWTFTAKPALQHSQSLNVLWTTNLDPTFPSAWGWVDKFSFLPKLITGHSVYLIKGVKCGWQAWLMLTVMLVVSSEALKRGNFERTNLCVQIVVSGLPSSSLPVSLRSKIRKSQPLPLSKIWPSSSDRLKVWSSEYVESAGVMFVSGVTNHQNENEREE